MDDKKKYGRVIDGGIIRSAFSDWTFDSMPQELGESIANMDDLLDTLTDQFKKSAHGMAASGAKVLAEQIEECLTNSCFGLFMFESENGDACLKIRPFFDDETFDINIEGLAEYFLDACRIDEEPEEEKQRMIKLLRKLANDIESGDVA